MTRTTHAPITHIGADTRPGADGDNPNAAPGHFDEIELMHQLRDVDSAQSENEMWVIAGENASIRAELRRLGGRRVEE